MALLLMGGSGPAGPRERPRRVVSLNLCTDQLLLALADRDQIASLSFLSRDPAISFLAEQAMHVPANEGKGEAILFSGADLVLAGGFGAHTKRELLERHGIEVLALDAWRNLDHGREQIRLLARRLGNAERGERMVAEIEAALARAKGIVPAGRSILVTYRRAWVPASDSLIGEILRHMGFALHQEALGLRQGGVPRLEHLVSNPPDYALMDEIVGRSVDNGSALLVHPALVEAIPHERRLSVAGKLTICGGPATPATIDALAAEVRAKVR
ncbi:MAG TPA: ABC transporter substrate-binding protein [Microvirga sp.]|nr:ABC transporter substrate-binding protein [Microvirga sp.]